jgi:iron complex outermembrane receptor protein
MRNVTRNVQRQLLAAAALGAMAVAAPAFAKEKARLDFNVEGQDLASALKAVARQSGRQILFPSSAVDGKRALRLRGAYTPEDAVRALIAETDLVAEFKEDAILIRGRSAPSGAVAELPAGAQDVVVTGSRIRGASSASPVISITQNEMRSSGQNSLADVVRNIPQNAGGGQNPGIGFNVPAGSGVNIAAASTINLRGIGSDATLTLLNGHRLAYNVTRQAIDISAIPLGAVDRIEIVADGASAIYGSDAVGGVANIILKRDFDGVATSARFGASTDGGNEQQQYGLVAGSVWSTGGVIAAYDYERDTPIIARERSYANLRSPGLTLYPYVRHHNALFSAHQAVTSNLTFEVDAIYNKRWSDGTFALNAAGDYKISGGAQFSTSESFAVAPSFRLAVAGWNLGLAGMYGKDTSNYGTDGYSAAALSSRTRGCYCNTARSVELDADGPIFRLPAGDAKLAIGGGYRTNDFHGYRTVGAAQNIRASQDSYYAFGELSVPLVSPEQGIALLDRLAVSAAGRYERYPGVDAVFTPKLGLIYAPSADLELKGSWGESFKTPTLYQQYNTQVAVLNLASTRGGVGYGPNATVIVLSGGNADLKPERATSWTVTAAIHPRAIPGLRLEISYFDVQYRDRIVAPVTFLAQALSNPIYRDLLNLTPTDADKASAIANAGLFSNSTGKIYDPANVVAIINNTNLNAAAQSLHGIDVMADYKIDIGSGNAVLLKASGSYLHSEQRLSPLQPTVQLAGAIFNPPHFRGRAGAAWSQPTLTISSFVNYTGSVRDVRSNPSPLVPGMTTTDLSIRYRPDRGSGIFRNLDLVLSAQNIFNVTPGPIQTTLLYEAPYDSTNYLPIGRFVSFSVTKKW